MASKSTLRLTLSRKGEEEFTVVLVLLAPGGDFGGKTARAVVHKSVEGVENGRDALFDRL